MMDDSPTSVQSVVFSKSYVMDHMTRKSYKHWDPGISKVLANSIVDNYANRYKSQKLIFNTAVSVIQARPDRIVFVR